jgi:hypothetical protein
MSRGFFSCHEVLQNVLILKNYNCYGTPSAIQCAKGHIKTYFGRKIHGNKNMFRSNSVPRTTG